MEANPKEESCRTANLTLAQAIENWKLKRPVMSRNTSEALAKKVASSPSLMNAMYNSVSQCDPARSREYVAAAEIALLRR